MQSRPVMTWEQIRTAFPQEYVLLDQVVLGAESRSVAKGRVCAHAPTRREVLAAVPASDVDFSWALKFTGPVRLPPGFTGLYVSR